MRVATRSWTAIPSLASVGRFRAWLLGLLRTSICTRSRLSSIVVDRPRRLIGFRRWLKAKAQQLIAKGVAHIGGIGV
jgi:hypothetical protein